MPLPPLDFQTLLQLFEKIHLVPHLGREACAALAAIVGIQAYPMSPILSTDLPTHGYVYTLYYDENGLQIDAFLDVSEGLTANSAAKLGKARLLDEPVPISLQCLTARIKGVEIRVRYNAELRGPYLIKCHGVLTREMLAVLLGTKTKVQLTRFLQESRL